MSTPYVGEIRMFSFPRVPTSWQACDGSLLSISEYQVLYTLIGTTYGGNGVTNFAVPDLRGRTPLHEGTGPGLTTRVLGEPGGSETVTLLLGQLPAHTHLFTASSQAGTAAIPGVTVTLAADPSGTPYFTPTTGATATPMSANTGGHQGGNTPHDNCAPTLAVNFCIALFGVFPSQG
jgi:microcystin-dependent protein